MGRTGSSYVITSYYDQAPLDEYGTFLQIFMHNSSLISLHSQRKLVVCYKFVGLMRQPKYGHLKELHATVKLCSDTILFGAQTNIILGQEQEVRSYNRLIQDAVINFSTFNFLVYSFS